MPVVLAFLLLATTHDPPRCDEKAWTDAELKSPCTNDDRQNPSAQALQDAWRLSPKVAPLAARAWAMGISAPASAAWLAVVRAAPERFEPIAALAARGWYAPPEHVITALEISTAPVENARRLLVGFRKQHLLGEQTPAIYGWLIHRGPAGMGALLQAGLEPSLLGVAAGLEGLARLDATGIGAAPSALRVEWTRATLTAAVTNSLPRLAAAIYRTLDAQTRDGVIADPGGGGDIRRALAVALVEEGARELARPLDRGPEAAVRVHYGARKIAVPCSDPNTLALRDRGTLSPAERFRARVSLRRCVYSAAELVAIHHHFPEDNAPLADQLRVRARDAESRVNDARPWANAHELEAPTKRVRGELAQEIARWRRVAGQLDGRAPGPRSADAKDAGSAARTSTAPFQEVAATLPKTKTVTETATVDCPQLPEEFDVVTARKTRDGACIAVAASQTLDPTSMVTRGGYWLFWQQDQKASDWVAGGIYLGLRVFRPYRIMPDGEMSLEGGLLRLTARRRQIDETSIMFPSVSTKFAEGGPLLTLQVTLAELRVDSDGDGLPDLEEERMFLDPRRKDTDGDGIGDAVDPLPNVSARGPVSPTAAILTAFFTTSEGEGGEPTGAAVATPGGAASKVPPLAPHKVTFVEGDPGTFVGVKVPSRTVVLRPDELRRAVVRLGSFYPTFIDLLVDPSGDRAFLWVDWGASGGTYQGTKIGGAWTLEALASWIS